MPTAELVHLRRFTVNLMNIEPEISGLLTFKFYFKKKDFRKTNSKLIQDVELGK